MLHNILLKAGEYTEIAKQGKFLNVVLAAGEITVRIRMSDLSTFETKLISGMSFPTEKEFQSVAFTSDTSQQTKVWVGDLPLSYSPMNSKVVGSSALRSGFGRSFYGEPSVLLGAESGRGKVTLSSLEDFFVGGKGVTKDSAIKIDAGSVFSISTQGAIYSFTDNQSDIRKEVGEPSIPLSFIDSELVVSGGSCLYYSSFDDTLIFRKSGSIKRISATKPHVSLSDLHSNVHARIERKGNKLFFLGGSPVALRTIDLVTGEDEILLLQAGGIYGSWAINKNEKFAHYYSYGAVKKLFVGDGVGGLVERNLPVVTGTEIKGIFVTDDGGIYIHSDTHIVRSIDDGVSWGQEVNVGFSLWWDCFYSDYNGAVYCSVNSSSQIYKSINNGESWNLFDESEGIIYLFLLESAAIYECFGDRVRFSIDGGVSWVEFAVLSRVIGVCAAENGIFYVLHLDGSLSRYAADLVVKGGLSVAIMSEVN